MKALLGLGLLFATPLLSAAPALHINTDELLPDSVITVSFERPIVKPDQVGKSIPNNLLEIDPPLAGTIRWTLPNTAVFERTGIPAIDTDYQFAIKAGLKSAEGAEVPADRLRTLSTEEFYCEFANWSGHTRTPKYFARFNDAVDPQALASSFVFIDKTRNVVAAKVERATYDPKLSRQMGPTWKQRFSGWKHPGEDKKGQAIPTAVVVAPVHPLPIGESWKIVMTKGLPNADGTAKLKEPYERWVGSVHEFKVSHISAVTRVDTPRYLSIGFSKSLPESIKPEDLDKFLTIEPEPANKKVTVERSRLTIAGDFNTQSEWKVTVKSGLTAADGLAMPTSVSETVKFTHLPPALALPSHDHAQLANGTRTYQIETVNLSSAHIRVKRLSGRDAIRIFQGYRHYTGKGPDQTIFKERHTIPYELVVGKTVYDQRFDFENGLDTSHNFELKWDEVLGSDSRTALLFVSITGDPKPGMEKENNKRRLTQAFVQLTDIGLAWKLTEDEAFVYAYSAETGQPLPQVRLELFGEDAAPLQSARTDRSGVARLPRNAEHRHLRASWGEDSVITRYDAKMPTVSMWRFPVRVSYYSELTSQRTALLFTDRDLYRPGETVHIKAIVRRIENNRSVLDTTPGAKLIIRDSSSRVLSEQDVTLSKQGSLDYSFELPAETVGFFNVELSWPEEVKAAEKENSWRMQAALRNSARFVHSINVQEFRRNAFKVEADFREEPKPGTLALDLSAQYYQGQPVANGKVKWFFRSSQTGFYPDNFRDYLFCDHRGYDPYYWSHYFGYSEDEYYENRSSSKNGVAELDAEGLALVEFPLETVEFPTPRRISVTSEVTDLRNQTLSARSSKLVHSSDLYVGVSRIDRLVRVGGELPLKVVVVTSDGEPATKDVKVKLSISREVNEQIKTKTESGTVAVRNEKRIEFLEERDLTIAAGPNQTGGITVPFAPKHSGRHLLTFTGTDSAGKPFRTTIFHHVYGTKEYPWAYESGMKIKLVPEKKRYLPGETARILILSPIEGTALVTIEREGVQRHETHELRTDDPVIEIALTDADAPNTYVSVLVIKGSQDSKREFKEPSLRLGFCELTVENRQDRLDIAMEIPGEYHRPGEEVQITGQVRDAGGAPVSEAEITLYAEDEGTLAVGGYDNPNPLAHFYAPRFLRTSSGTSLGNFVMENPDDRYRFNKGFFIGDAAKGGAFEDSEAPLRVDFDPCAVWAPALLTDAQGKFELRFDSPDTLTRYRVIAVAHHGAGRFGNGLSEFTVNKPLMLEPSVPRFAHEGDRLQPKVLVQNSTAFRGVWQVTLKLGSITNFVEGDEKAQTRTILLDPQSSETVSFDLTFADTGSVDWQWSAIPVSLEGSDLSKDLRIKLADAVVTNFDVEYPMPLLRETRFVRFEDPAARRNLLKGFSPELLDGRGKLDLEFGRSLLLEAGDAVDYLLRYPYGCLEQTTSSTMPWVAALQLRDHVPAFQKHTEDEIRHNIQVGANRLLTMQHPDGGFSYWGGDGDRSLWLSAYGGMALLLCKEAGAEVPASAVEKLTKNLSDQLRGIGEVNDWWKLETAARACYTLALADAPQEAYHNKLIERAETLSPGTLNFLALAVHRSGTANAAETAATLLEARGVAGDRSRHFMRYHPDSAYRLLALATVAPESGKAEEVVDRMIQQRSRSGHWGTTWSNAWSLYALGQYAAKVENQDTTAAIQFVTNEDSREIRLDQNSPSESVRIPLHGGLEVSAAAPKGAFARVKLASKPKLAPSKPVSANGLQILRRYLRVRDDGTTEELQEPRLGDLVKVELQVTLPRDGTRYLAIDDPLPALFETVNSSFKSQAGRVANQSNWRISHQELRDDRAVFFLNYVPRGGTYTTSYYARVTSAGEATAPPAKVEAMYEPEFFALSSSRKFKTPNPLLSAMR